MKPENFIKRLEGRTIKSVELLEGYNKDPHYCEGFALNFTDGTKIEFDTYMCQGSGFIEVKERFMEIEEVADKK